MSGPWEDFRTAEKPPWEDFRAAEKGQDEDQYRRAAREDIARSGSGTGSLQRQIMQGLTFGAADEIIAGAMTPLEMIRRGTWNPVEGYNYAKAREDLALEQDRQRDGVLGSVAEIGAGVASGVGAANAGLTAGRFLGANAGLGARSLAAAADGAAYGGLAGAMTGSGEGRLSGAATGAMVGGAVGGALPGVIQGVSTLASPITSNISARMNPDRFAQNQVARAISESGRAPQQIIDDVAAAARDGQGVFTVADAMGNPGQRMLSTVARNPGAGRTQAVEFLDARQAGQAGRVRDIIDDAFGVTQTGRSTSGELMQWARDASDPFYKKALAESPVWNERINQFLKDPISNQGLRRGLEIQRLESVARGEPFNPYDFVRIANEGGQEVLQAVPNMRTINIIKKGIDDIIEQYRDPTTGVLRLNERGRAINEFQRSFLSQIDEINPTYAKARSLYAGPAQINDRIYQGGVASTRGRPADNIDQFSRITDPAGQQGFRVGYADRLASTMESGAQGVNAVRRLSSDKFSRELPAFALPDKRDSMVTALGRERTMFETRRQATGGSGTKENFADDAAMGVAPELGRAIMGGSVRNIATALLSSGQAVMSGNTAPVREKLAEILLARGGDAAQIGTILQQAQTGTEAKKRLIEVLMRGAIGGGAAAPGALNSPSTSGR